jgi:hypothetical protein
MKRFRDTDYFVTEDGDVYRLWKFKGYKKLKLIFDAYGYYKVSIYKKQIRLFFKGII